MKSTFSGLTINLGLIVFGMFSIFSGYLLQIGYHLQNQGTTTNDKLLGLNHYGWSASHKISVTILLLFLVYHLYQHRKWYNAIVKKRLFAKNRQVLSLSLIFILTAITGFTPWILVWHEGNEMIRNTIIEIHDKLAIFFTVYFVLHIRRKFKRIIGSFEK